MGGWRRGVAAGLAGLGAIEGVTALLRSRSFLDASGQLVVDTGPLPLVERTVQLLRTADKPVIRVAVASAVLAASGLLGGARRRRVRDVAVAAAAGGIGVAVARRRPADGAGVVDESWGAALAAGAGVVGSVTALRAPSWVAAAGAALGAAGTITAARAQARHRSRQDEQFTSRALSVAHPLPPAVDGAEAWAAATPLLTPVEQFYVTDVNMRPPIVDPTRWRLQISGAAAAPMSLTYDDLLGLGLVEFDAVMVCIHNRVGWDRLGNARWTGVPLRPLLMEAAPHAEAAFLVSRSVDGWECSMPLSLLDELAAYVVVGMNGRPVTAAHGFPARLFVPGLYGQYTGAKWLTELRLQSEPNRDYWLPRGWARGPVRVRPFSRIDAPASRTRRTAGPVEITGVAWAPPVGVRSVEVAVDDQRWEPAELAVQLAPAAWRRWRMVFTLPPGRHRVRVRCTAADGTVQDPRPRPPFPTGATGHHTITITAA